MCDQIIGAGGVVGFVIGAVFVALFRWSERSEKKPSKPLLTWEDGWRQGRESGLRDGRWEIEMAWQTWLYTHNQEHHPEPKPDVF